VSDAEPHVAPSRSGESARPPVPRPPMISDVVVSRLAQIVREAATLTAAPMVALWIADAGTRTLRVAAASEALVGHDLPLVTLAFGQGGVGWVAAEQAPLEVDDVFTDSRFVGRDWWRRHGGSSFLGLPILLDDQLLGVLALNGPQPLRFSAAEHALLATLIDEAAHALHGARLERWKRFLATVRKASCTKGSDRLASFRRALTNPCPSQTRQNTQEDAQQFGSFVMS
jgi:signal transduction protein with GAF and PtsI domain